MKQLLLPMDLPREPTLREELALRGILSEGERLRRSRIKHSARKKAKAAQQLEFARLGANALSLPEDCAQA